MSKSAFQQPSQEDINAFVLGDPIAMDHVVTLLAPQLIRWACQNYPDLPEADVEELVYSVFYETCCNHSRYDPSKSLLTSYIINLIKLRAIRSLKKVNVIRIFEDTSKETQENLPKSVYNKLEVKELEIEFARKRFYKSVKEKLQGLDLEFFELEFQFAESYEFAEAVKRTNEFLDPDSEAKNRRARVRRTLKKIAEELGYNLNDLIRE